jgi:hypothetical protein
MRLMRSAVQIFGSVVFSLPLVASGGGNGRLRPSINLADDHQGHPDYWVSSPFTPSSKVDVPSVRKAKLYGMLLGKRGSM